MDRLSCRWWFSVICFSFASILILAAGRVLAAEPTTQAIQTLAEHATAIDATDRDGDRVADDLEQDLLQKFVPTFLVDPHDCDLLPAEFTAGLANPRAAARNGTIYGQVFPRQALTTGSLIEIHYYHLWSRDCGRAGHSLDAEHVSVLIGADNLQRPAAEWKALYWYAAAHEGTVCDASTGASAATMVAPDRGASVWISSGKHGSFLAESKCRLGCGGDSCRQSKAMAIQKIINIGEPGVALNGARWAASMDWPLSSKMQSDFTADVVGRLEDSSGEVLVLNSPPPPTKALILGSNSSLSALLVGNEWAGKSLVIAGSDSVLAAGKALSHSSKALRFFGRKVMPMKRPERN